VGVVRRRRRYCDLYAKVLDKVELTGKDAEELELLEEQVAVEWLVAWRMLVEKKRSVTQATQGGAAKPVRKQSSRVSRKPSEKKKGAWMSWFRGGQKSKGEEDDEEDEGWDNELVNEEEEVLPASVDPDDITLEQLALQVAEEDEKTGSKSGPVTGKDFELFRVNMSSKGTLRLFGRDRRCLLESTSAFNLQASQRGDSIAATFNLADFAILDRFTPTAVFENIVRAGGNSDESIFDLRVVIEPQLTSVWVRTRPLDIAYVPSWVAKLLQLFHPPEGLREALVDRAATNFTQARAYAKENLAGSALQADIEISAPRIFVPVSESKDYGFLLLDTGRLCIKGGTAPEDTKVMVWDVKLSDIQSKLPRKKGDWVIQENDSSSQLIEPFSISLSLRMKQGDDEMDISSSAPKPEAVNAQADMVVAVELKPGVKGIITPKRLKTLMYVVTHLALPEDETVNQGSSGLMESDSNQIRRPTLDVLGVADNKAVVHPQPAPPPQPSDLNASPEHKKMDVHVAIAQIALELRMDSETDHPKNAPQGKLFYLCIDRFDMTMLSRSFDSTMDVTLDSFFIMSLRRPEGLGQYRYLAQTLTDADTTSLFHVQIVDFIGGDKSPLYSGFDRVLSITFSQLWLNCDGSSILLLKPFYGALMNFDDEVPLDVVSIRRSSSTGKKS